MENTLLISAASALWFGILTSISPCPLTTNIAAVSYIGKNIDKSIYSLLSGILYALGRMFTYSAISIAIVASLTSIPALSMFLQTKINIFLGPILVFTGLVLVEIIKLNIGNNSHLKYAGKLAQKGSFIGAVLIGVLFALAFCPVSAALFFGSAVPLSLKHQSYLLIPALYGLGTAIPVIVFALFISIGAHYVGAVFHKLSQIEIWARRITGIVFIVVGLFFILTYIFKIHIF